MGGSFSFTQKYILYFIDKKMCSIEHKSSKYERGFGKTKNSKTLRNKQLSYNNHVITLIYAQAHKSVLKKTSLQITLLLLHFLTGTNYI